MLNFQIQFLNNHACTGSCYTCNTNLRLIQVVMYDDNFSKKSININLNFIMDHYDNYLHLS